MLFCVKACVYVLVCMCRYRAVHKLVENEKKRSQTRSEHQKLEVWQLFSVIIKATHESKRGSEMRFGHDFWEVRLTDRVILFKKWKNPWFD
jgi:hypothetical protein